MHLPTYCKIIHFLVDFLWFQKNKYNVYSLLLDFVVEELLFFNVPIQQLSFVSSILLHHHMGTYAYVTNRLALQGYVEPKYQYLFLILFYYIYMEKMSIVYSMVNKSTT